MTRPHFTRKDRSRIFNLREGKCYLCDGLIDFDQGWDIEHVIPWEISRDNADPNLMVAHKKCHAIKTRDDRKDIAKVHRIEAKHKGTAPKSRAPLRSRGFSKSRIWES